MMTIRRYARAFIGALKLTLRGETIQPAIDPHPNLTAWWQSTIRLTDAAFASADNHGFPKSRRETLVLRIEGRDVSMETILKTVRFHADQEFPVLMRQGDNFGYLTMQATVMNDRFLVDKLAHAATLPDEIKAAVAAITAHLDLLPRKDHL
ncbi:MAG: hypothetical protein J0M07_11490 [Anaerolineae bacterium]|nr:hypothetical protein [Anaerolineae bacterium]